MMLYEIILKIIGGIGGIVLVVGGIFKAYEPVKNLIKRTKLIITGKRINATVVGKKNNYTRIMTPKYHLVLRYTIDNKTHKVTYKFGFVNKKAYKLSQIVEITCNNDNPKDIVIVRDMRTVAETFIVALLGLFLTAFGFLLLIASILDFMEAIS